MSRASEAAGSQVSASRIKVRRATPDDAPALHRQWADAGWVTLDQRIPQREIKTFPAWVAELSGEIVAGAFAVPFQQQVGGASFTMAGIRGVTCAVQLRRRGIVDQLFRALLEEARSEFELSALWPFSPPFYERYEYGVCGRRVFWRFLLEDLDAPEPPSAPRRLTRADTRELLSLAHSQVDHVGNGGIVAEQYWMESLYFPREEAEHEPVALGWFDHVGNMVAAIAFSSRIGGGQWRNRIEVRDWLGVDAEWRRRALGFLRTLRDQYVEAEVHLPENDLFYHHVKKPYRYDSTIPRGGSMIPGMRYEPGWQARLLDPATVLARPRELHGPGGQLLVDLTDSVFADLNGRFVWTIDRHQPGWLRVDDAAAGGAAAGGGGATAGGGDVATGGESRAYETLPRLRISLAELTRLWMGAVDAYTLRRLERIACDDEAAAILHAAFGGFRCDMQIKF